MAGPCWQLPLDETQAKEKAHVDKKTTEREREKRKTATHLELVDFGFAHALDLAEHLASGLLHAQDGCNA